MIKVECDDDGKVTSHVRGTLIDLLADLCTIIGTIYADLLEENEEIGEAFKHDLKMALNSNDPNLSPFAFYDASIDKAIKEIEDAN